MSGTDRELATRRTVRAPSESTRSPRGEEREVRRDIHRDAAPDPAVAAARAALAALFGPAAERGFDVRLWEGTTERGGAAPGAGAPFTLVVRRPGALRRAFLPPSEIALAEAYLRDDLDVEGDLGAASLLADLLARRLGSVRGLRRGMAAVARVPADAGADAGADAEAEPDADPDGAGARRRWRGSMAVGRLHTRGRDRSAVRFHYDVGNDFYALWLDRRMQYSCGYFAEPGMSLDEAQEAKLEHLCRKLRLRPGDRLLDIGCGWGGLLEYAATRHGVEGVGITLSERQAEGARERLARAGLADRCRIEVRDYRTLEGTERFDRIVSVGMREHVGRRRLPEYFAVAYRLLRPGGIFVDHGIARGGGESRRGLGRARAWAARRLWGRDVFIQRYVFPDGELVPAGPLLEMGERSGLEARDVENLREHYARTLRAWVRNLEARHEEAARLVGERTYRVWRLYMAATVHGFTSGRLTLLQTVYAKPHAGGRVELPATRGDLYAP